MSHGVSASPVLRMGMLTAPALANCRGWLPAGAVGFVPNGRSALLAAFRALGVPTNGTVALPAYLCESVVTPVTAHGARPVFYSVSKRLEPDLDSVEALIKRERPQALVAIHYFGFPVPRWLELRRLAESFGVPVIEDCAHALYSRTNEQFLGGQGAAAIFSLRKSLPTPEGGVLVMRHQNETIGHSRAHWTWRELGGVVREIVFRAEDSMGLSLRARLGAADRVSTQLARRNDDSLMAWNGGVGVVSHHIAQRVDYQSVVSIRRHNFLRILECVEEFPSQAVPLYRELPVGVCPVGFPLLVEKRDAARRTLANRGIGVRMFWHILPEELPIQEFPHSAYLRDRILVLPVHQDMKDRHLNHLVEALRNLWSNP